MALPSSGPISLSDVNVELGLSATAQISMGDTIVRNLFGIGSGIINMQNGRGRASLFAFTITSNQTNANLATLATNAGWNGSSEMIATIASGVFISSDSTSTPALTVSGSFPGGVELINNGYICGMGGTGGSSNSGAGGAGGTALSVSTVLTLANNGTIAGGGGGGGAGWGVSGGTGGGGGGGRTGHINSSGGYRVGGTGTSSGAGGGGAGSGRYYDGYNYFYATNGGAGGNWGASGASGHPNWRWGGGGAGGAGGKCVQGNILITWTNLGSRYGAVV